MVARLGVGYSPIVLKPCFIVMMWMTGCGCVFAEPIDDLYKQLEDPEWNRMYELKQAERPHIVRAQFIEVERVNRLGYWQQKSHLHRLYFNLLPELRKNYAIGLAISPERIDTTSGTPEQIADRILAHKWGGEGFLNNDALDRCRNVLRQHPREVFLWVSQDFGQGKPFDNWLFDDNLLTKEHYADLVGLLNRPEPAVAADAARQLCRWHIGDWRAISLIVRRFPSLQAENEASGFPLGNLQIRRNANPDLLRLLSSQNGDVRFRATKALVHSCDPSLAPHGEKLLKDPDERVRKAAEEMMKNVKSPIPDDVPIGFAK